MNIPKLVSELEDFLTRGKSLGDVVGIQTKRHDPNLPDSVILLIGHDENDVVEVVVRPQHSPPADRPYNDQLDADAQITMEEWMAAQIPNVRMQDLASAHFLKSGFTIRYGGRPMPRVSRHPMSNPQKHVTASAA